MGLSALIRTVRHRSDRGPVVDAANDDDRSHQIDRARCDRFCVDPDAPFLVSFPRTGSHWLRMMMELYFERPTLVRAFYYADREDYLAYHTHDMDLAWQRQRVVYLYRDPVDTVFSQVMYEQQSPEDEGAARQWAGRYAEHLAKWLVHERFTTDKLLVRYEDLRADLHGTFARITNFFGQPFDPAALSRASERVTKDEVKRKTSHDPQVVQLKRDYEAARAAFREDLGPIVREVVFGGHPELCDAFGVALPQAPSAESRPAPSIDDPPLRLSAVVCSCNEAHYLPECLESLAFCDERIVIDLGSTDETVAVAAAHGARVVPHPRVPVVEQVRRFAVEQARHDWVVFFDPDTMFPAHRQEELRTLLASSPHAGRVSSLQQNYFKRRPIHHGPWSGLGHCTVAIHRRRVELNHAVHAGIRLKDGWAKVVLPDRETEADAVKHYWVDSIGYMIAKHRRYARAEGPVRYERGERFAWRTAIRSAIRETKRGLIWKAGWRDGLQGVGLSLFWGWYHWACLMALRRTQRQRARQPEGVDQSVAASVGSQKAAA